VICHLSFVVGHGLFSLSLHLPQSLFPTPYFQMSDKSNIQHLGSLNDLVARITGVVVRERVPDRILDEADEIVVIDVTPETLQERLLEGKIYAPEKIQ
jgi:broad-specificity NMP kinase